MTRAHYHAMDLFLGIADESLDRIIQVVVVSSTGILVSVDLLIYSRATCEIGTAVDWFQSDFVVRGTRLNTNRLVRLRVQVLLLMTFVVY